MLQRSRELTKKTENDSNSEDEEEVQVVSEKNAIVLSSIDSEDESGKKKTYHRNSQLETLNTVNRKAGGWLDGSKSTSVYADKQLGSQVSQFVDHGEKAVVSQAVLSSRAREKLKNQKSKTDYSTAHDVPEVEEINSEKGPETKRKFDLCDMEITGDEVTGSDIKKEGQKQHRKKKRVTDENIDEDIGAQNLKETKKKAVKELSAEIPFEPKAYEEETNERHDSLIVTMEELFQDEDVVEQFAIEKSTAEAKVGLKFKDSSLPGWGSWSGADFKGEKPLTKKQRR